MGLWGEIGRKYINLDSWIVIVISSREIDELVLGRSSGLVSAD
jgi:hypothetical protein